MKKLENEQIRKEHQKASQRKYEKEKIVQVSLKFRKDNPDEMMLVSMLKVLGAKDTVMEFYRHYLHDVNIGANK